MTQLQTILHPTDLSGSSEQALRIARDLARKHGARLILLHVVEAGTVPVNPLPTDPVLDQARSALEQRAAQLTGENPSLAVECRILHGLAVELILAAADETQCDLIVMGSQGRTGLARVLLGSVAERVARGAPCRVLILKPAGVPAGEQASPDAPYRTILVPTDFSSRSREALELVGALAREGTRVIELHNVVAVHIATEGLTSALEERLREFKVDEPGIRMEYRLREGDPADEILGEARESSCDLIVMSSHGRTGLDRLLLGSVAEKVLRGAPCAVLVLRTPARSG